MAERIFGEAAQADLYDILSAGRSLDQLFEDEQN